MKLRQGFTLFEVLIVIAVMIIVASIGMLNLGGYRNIQDLESDAKLIVSFMRDAQQRAIAQEEDSQWGVNFDNKSLEIGYFEVYKGTAYSAGVVYIHKSLHQEIEFTTPTRGSAAEISFKKITGESNDTTTQSVTIGVKGSTSCITGSKTCLTIALEPNGAIKYCSGPSALAC